jgi:lysozyme family protein
MANILGDFRGVPLLDYIIDKWEGRQLTNNKNDLGGATIFGITEKLARECGFTRDMATMTYDEAVAIYSIKFWGPMSLDLVDDQKIAAQIMQAAINQGQPRWAKYVQEICNGFMAQDAKLKVDGYVGEQTICAINLSAAMHGLPVLSKAIHDRQQERYDKIVEKNSGQKGNREGWRRRAADFLITA